MKILISACLLGEPCRYDGRSKPVPEIQKLAAQGYELIPVCPEVLGGLDTPRPPAELQPDGRVMNEVGADVTAAYQKGAELALALAQKEGCILAVLKEKSPSCGNREVYDGTFSRQLTAGQGVTARLLTQHGISVLGESQISQLIQPKQAEM